MVGLAQLDDIVSFHIPKPDTYCIMVESILDPWVEGRGIMLKVT
jgi:hypothetical protein